MDWVDKLKELEDAAASLPSHINSEQINNQAQELLEALRNTNPYNVNVKSNVPEETTLTFCFTNNTEEYQKKFLTTAILSYLFRSNDEWGVPEGVPVVDTFDYFMNPDKREEYLSPPKLPNGEQIGEELAKKYADTKAMMDKRFIVLEFLLNVFGFDPDRDVKSSYSPIPIDPNREIVNTPAAKAAMIAEDKKTKLTPETKEFKDTVKRTVIGRDGKKMTLAAKAGDRSAKIETTDMKDASLPHYGYEILPPVDLYAKFNRYLIQNFEELQKVVYDVYGVKDLLEYAILPLAVHKSREEYEAYKRENATKLVMSLVNVNFGAWSMMAHYKKNLEATQIFSSSNRLLESMQRKLIEDAKIGEELTKKRVMRKKAENEKQYGKPSEAFMNNMKTNPNKLVTEYKMANPLGNEAMEQKVADPQDTHPDCPDDAVAVDVFTIKDGGRSVHKSVMYTEAQAPTAWHASDGNGPSTPAGPIGPASASPGAQ